VLHYEGSLDRKDALQRVFSVIRQSWEDLARAINGQISFGSPAGGSDNINAVWATGTSPAGADTEFEVVHNLGRVPVAFIPVNKNKAGDIYAGGTSWTTTKLYLKCSVSSLAYTLLVF